LPALRTTLCLSNPEDELELDEIWTWVSRRKNKRWLWLALCRRTRQIVAYAIGCRGQATCRALWNAIPEGYKKSLCYTDLWEAYAQVIPARQHDRSDKRGRTNHIERCNNTLRQRIGRLVRQTLSFSKCEHMHENVIRIFIHEYNQTKVTY
jgi:IS1 family transposase